MLSDVNPDFETLVADLQNYLKTKKANWKDLNTSALGETLIELMSAVALYNQYSIEQSFRESFSPTLSRKSSAYALARTLGVRIGRKEPASYIVEITNKTTTNQSILPFSEFFINGDSFFNEDQIVIPPVSSGSIKVLLKQGQVLTKTFTAKGEYLEEIVLGEPGFVVADTELKIKTIDQFTGKTEIWRDIREVSNGVAEVLWKEIYSKNRVFVDNTTGDGDVTIKFMDTRRSDFDTSASVYIKEGTSIEVSYVKTKGFSVEIDVDRTDIEIPFNQNLIGKTVANSGASGADEKPAVYYQTFAPYVHRSRGQAISKRDFHSIISLFPDVADVQVQGQRETYPNDVRWMNVIRICVLPINSDSWGGQNPNPHVNVYSYNPNSRWLSFMEKITPKMHEAYKIQTYNPNPVLVNVEIKVFMKPYGKESTLKPKIEKNIEQLFAKGIGTLGKNIPVSDIVNAATIFDDVDYVTLVDPQFDLVLCGPSSDNSCKLSFFKLSTLNVHMYYSERRTLEVFNY